MGMSKAVCAHCRRKIDAAAKLCPYCGADPVTGQKLVDTQALLQEVFQPRQITTSESVLEYARQRQGVVIAIGLAVVFLILAALHQYISMRNSTAVAEGPAVPLTEVTDLSSLQEEGQQQAMPDLQFQYDGNPQRMRQYVVEQGAVTPPEVQAAQAAAQAAQQPAAAPAAAPPPAPPRPPAR